MLDCRAPGERKRGLQSQPQGPHSLCCQFSLVRTGTDPFSASAPDKGRTPIDLVLGRPSSRVYSPSPGLSEHLGVLG